MNEADRSGYTITDPRPIARASPYTFFRPDEAEIAAVQKGDIVQLIFEYDPPGQDWGAERMWVTVREADGQSLTGVLENEPTEPTARLIAGETVEFARHAIISIEWAEPSYAPPHIPYREYWERCYVDACVLDGTEPVEYIYRDPPEPTPEGDRYPDSGWCIRGRFTGLSDEVVDAREAWYVALGAVLNKDDSWLAHIDDPVGTRLIRNFETNRYTAAD